MSATSDHDAASAVELRSAVCAIKAFRNVLGAPRALAKIAALPGLLILVMISAYSAMPWYNLTLSPFALAVLAVPLGALGDGWLRMALLETPPRFLAAAPWKQHAFGAMLYTLPCLLWMLAAPAILEATFDILDAAGSPAFELTLTFTFCYVALGLYLSARLLLATPALAVGRSVGPAAAWRLAAGRSLGIFGGFCLIVIIMLVACVVAAIVYNLATSAMYYSLDEPAGLLWRYWWLPNYLEVITSLGLTIGAAVVADYLALVYRALTGWRGPQRKIVARFE